MSKPKTRIAFVLDKSGSMSSTADAAISGFNEQIQQAKERVNTQDILASVVTFNGDVFEHLWDVPADQLVEAKLEDYKPSGGTAMRDAMGYTIQKLLDTENNDDKTCYLIYVISDGQTNSDQHYFPALLRELVQGCQATGRWTFTYMGCKENLADVAQQTGIPMSNTAAWSNSTKGATSYAFSNQKLRMKKYLDQREMGIEASCLYSCDVDGAAADYSDESVDMAVGAVVPPTGTTNTYQKQVEAALNAGVESKVEEKPAEVKPVDLKEVVTRLPKYSNRSVRTGNDNVFSNVVGVQWEGRESALPDYSSNNPYVMNPAYANLSFAGGSPKQVDLPKSAATPKTRKTTKK